MDKTKRILSKVPASRRSDPDTSHEAEEHINATGKRANQQHLTLSLVQDYPGRTSAELAQAGNVCRFILARRLPELDFMIERGPARKCNVTGRRSQTWWPKKGK